MDCPACAGQLNPREVAGAQLRRCDGCGGFLIGRPALARLREAPPSGAELGDVAGARAPATGGKAVIRTCPGCGRSMLGFAYGGGNTRVEGCDACEHLFLERGELDAILHEARHGIALDEAAQRTLHQHRAWGALGTIDSAEVGLATAGVVALYLFLKLVGKLGPSAFTVSLAAALAAGLFVWWRRRLRAQKERAEVRLERIKEAELWRIEQAARAASTARSASEPARSASEPGSALPSSSPGRARKSAACPFCRARLPGGTTHCSACDTDFG